MVPAYGSRPQEIDPKKFITSGKINCENDSVFFIQQHCVWSEYTELMVRLTNTKIIFQHRNIFDVMVSARDHYLSAIMGNSETQTIPKPLFKLDKKQLMDYIIDTKCGWYCEFLQGWLQSSLYNSNNFCQVRYEDLKENTFETIKFISSSLSLNFKTDQIRSAIRKSAQSNTRKNIGENNRSKLELTQKQEENILKIASYYNLPSEYVHLTYFSLSFLVNSGVNQSYYLKRKKIITSMHFFKVITRIINP